MKKLMYYSCIILAWMSVSASNVLADFSLIDSDGDVYHVGEFLGHELQNQKYYVNYVSSDSFFPEGEGILYYDNLYQSLKLVIFENDEIFGFTMEGHWQGSGSAIFYINSDGQTGAMDLFFGDRLPPRKASSARVKDIIKQ